jgi:hypothetical protein
MAGDLFVKARKDESLSEFAHRMATLLDVGQVERRESSSYIDEEYYKGAALAVIVTFAKADEPDLGGFEFWIHLESTEVWIENPLCIDGLADLLARSLTRAGERVVRMRGAERKDNQKLFYAIDEGVPPEAKGRIVTAEG